MPNTLGSVVAPAMCIGLRHPRGTKSKYKRHSPSFEKGDDWMSQVTALQSTPLVGRVQLRIPQLFAMAIALTVLWLVLLENAQFLSFIGQHAAAGTNYLHELFHDARHMVGVPCH